MVEIEVDLPVEDGKQIFEVESLLGDIFYVLAYDEYNAKDIGRMNTCSQIVRVSKKIKVVRNA